MFRALLTARYSHTGGPASHDPGRNPRQHTDPQLFPDERKSFADPCGRGRPVAVIRMVLCGIRRDSGIADTGAVRDVRWTNAVLFKRGSNRRKRLPALFVPGRGNFHPPGENLLVTGKYAALKCTATFRTVCFEPSRHAPAGCGGATAWKIVTMEDSLGRRLRQ